MTVFTDRFIRGLKPADRYYEERDTACPGLLIRIGKRGQKTWEVIVSYGGRRRRHRIGTYPDVQPCSRAPIGIRTKGRPNCSFRQSSSSGPLGLIIEMRCQERARSFPRRGERLE